MGGGNRLGDVEAVAAKDSPVHRLDPRVKIVGLIGLVVVSVSLPPGAWLAFGALAAVLVGLVVAARLHPLHVLRRMSVEVPFLLAAAILPFTAEDGLVLGATVGLKITIGVLAMVILSSTTTFPRLLRGFELLKTPRLVVVIVAFMWRYLHVLADEVSRMKRARAARGYSAGWFWQSATSTGALISTLFVRSLERGERVYLAMLSRGYSGSMPATAVERLALRPTDVFFLAALAVVLALVRVALP
ncbi:MAG: cobalt ECF transporter T component CbiQ [Actinomycetota bacterium]|nr:cobalt ECF transporter T component CbiQ [Actinomycetota bacterium]